MKRIFIPEKVVFYIESNREVGTIHDLKSDKRAYVNSDMIEVIQHLLDGHVLDSFFPAEEIPQKERMELISQSKSVLRNYVLSNWLIVGISLLIILIILFCFIRLCLGERKIRKNKN